MRINKAMKTLGIDQSITSTGVVITEDDKMLHHEIITSDAVDDDIWRCEQIADRIVEIINQFDIDRVICEGLAFGASGDATRKLGGLQFIIISYVRNKTKIDDVKIVPPTTMKKFASENGRASKEELFESLPKPIKESVSTYKKSKGRYDITDAYWLSKMPD